MPALVLCVAVIILAVMMAGQTAQAKISPTSGVYDGRGKTPEKFKVLPGKPKRQPRGDVTATREK